MGDTYPDVPKEPSVVEVVNEDEGGKVGKLGGYMGAICGAPPRSM
jgi:hypothetical protein